MSKTIFQEYEDYLETYQREYGKKTVVLMEVGSFYEMYAVDNAKIDLYAIGDLLNIQVTRRNKAVLEVSRTNHLLAGFPSFCLDKFTNVLIDDGYTVVIVSQVSPPPKPQRGVTSVRSPGTRLENVKPHHNSYLMCIYIDEECSAAGASYVDISTGECHAFETANLDDLYRKLIIVAPEEVLFIAPCDIGDVLKRFTDVLAKSVVHVKSLSPQSEILNKHYQRQLLQTVYPRHGLLTVVEYIDMEHHPYALLSLIALLRFAFMHNERILAYIQRPNIESNNELVVSNNACLQLNIVGPGKNLLDTLNRCKTAIGRRAFKRRLLSPTTDIDKLRLMYDTIAHFLDDYVSIRVTLGDVGDMERAFRRIGMGTLHPMEFQAIDASMCKLSALMKYAFPMEWDVRVEATKHAVDMVRKAYVCLDITKAAKYNVDGLGSENIFCVGIFEDIDSISQDLARLCEDFTKLADTLNDAAGGPFFKVEKNERDGYHLSITTKRFEGFRSKCAEGTYASFGEGVLDMASLQSRPMSALKVSKVTHPLFKDHNEHITQLQEQLQERLKSEYTKLLSDIADACSQAFQDIVTFIADLDYATTNAANATDFCYSRPTIEAADAPFLNVKGLRHPVVERIQDNLMYVPNDVVLGGGGDGGSNGLLLYGVNASGKSCLMKSVGLALVMACAGMYVPCASMVFHPFRKIFTRIPGGDDISKGHSTFTNEISELRSILKHADSNSIVIGDELCCGTESVSAMAIVAAGIQTLFQRGSCFIFASHLHDLVDLPQIQSQRLRVFHLGVRHQEGKLIYDRVLKPGRGETVYGLEVCKALDLPCEFMELAQEVRHHILGVERNLVSSKKSRYNRRLFKGHVCGVCGVKAAQEVHHIHEQHKADKKGVIGSAFKKNALHNLVYLCEECHDNIHDGKVSVVGYKQTSHGRELMVLKNESN